MYITDDIVSTYDESHSSLISGILEIICEDLVGENDEADIKTTIMDPNTRTLIRVQIGDIENDMSIFQMLRGGTPADALGRKMLINEFKFDQSMIDT